MTDLIRIEDVLDDPITGTHVKFIKLGPDGFVVEQTIVPHKTKSTLNHFHKSWTETFEIISGVCSCNVAGQVYNGGPGDVFVVKPGQTHIHPWNTGDAELHFRQTDTFDPVDDMAAVNTFLGFSTMFGLAREGKTSADGTPRNPLQLMVILELFRLHGGYLADVPVPAQDILMGLGAKLGRILGYRAWYEHYLPSQTN